MKEENNINKFAYFISLLTPVLTIVTFGIAISTPPLAGPFCTGPCFEYPYTDIISRFPRDYIWMYPAILLNITYLIFMVCIHHYSSLERKIFSHIGLSFALIAAATLIINYFVQISVIQPSLLNGETDGIALLTQFNSHGLFIALEDIGYLMMSLSFLFMALVFSNKSRLEKAIRRVFILGFMLSIISLIIISIKFGINREYIFEISVITIDWTVLIISGILMSRIFRLRMVNTKL